MPSLEERIQHIEDRDAIRELTGRYCHLVVERDADALANLFTEDGIMKFGETQQTGRDELRSAYRESLEVMQPKPCVHNHVIQLDGDRATGVTSVELRFFQDGEPWIASGHYDEIFQRVGGEWKFARRELSVYHWVAHREGWA